MQAGLEDRSEADSTKLTGGIRAQWGPTYRLATPVILAELSWMAMGIVDTVMVGGLGPEAIGAVSLGGAIHIAVVIFGMGLLLGLDPLVSQAVGAGRRDDARRGLVQGVYLALIVTPPMIGLQYLAADHLAALGGGSGVSGPAASYLRAMSWSTGPLMIFGAFRHYLQAGGKARPVMVAMATANLINWLGNVLLIGGRLGFPALGVDGSGWSTVVARAYMAAVVIAATSLLERGSGRGLLGVPLSLDPARLARLVRLGLPAAVQVTLEIGVFAVATILASRLDPASLAAHQIVLNVSGVTFMVPLGISQAASVRVGHAIGRGDPAGAAAAGWSAIGLGAAVMATAAVALVALPRTIAGAFSDDPAVLAIAVRLLAVAACFQLFDGVQVVTIGALRGTGDTRTPMLVNLLSHWAIGLPIAAWLGLGRGWGVVGLWMGLSSGLIVTALVLLVAWAGQARAIATTITPN